jgi:simple sugar transport system permease protein
MTYVDQEFNLTTEFEPEEDAPIPPREIRYRNAIILVIAYTISIAIALAASALLIAATKHSPHDAFEAMFTGALKTRGAWGRTLEQASPLLLVAIGSVVANRAGVFNIGQEGQLLIGAMAGVIVALHMPGPHPLVIVLTLIAAFAGGALWSGIAAGLKAWRGVNVVITTLLLIFIAGELVQFAVTREWFLQQTNNLGIASPQSDVLSPGVRLPRFGSPPGFYLQSGLLFGVGLTILVAWLLARTRWGFRLKMLGHNPNAARHAGVSVVAVGSAALLISGGFAGLAGGVMLTSTVFSLQPSMANNIGWEGLLVALVARNRPVAVFFVAIFFGALRAGGGFLATTGIPKYLVDIIQAFLVFSTLFPPMFMSWLERRRVARSAPTPILPTPAPQVAAAR